MSKKMTEEQKKEHTAKQLVFELKQERQKFINEPTILYKVGDRVIHGAIKESYVKEVLDDGKILFLHEICTENNYGNPYDYERDIYVSWQDIQYHREDTPEVFRKEEPVFFQTYQQDISSIWNRYYHFGIDMNPDYQRGNVWALEDKVALIDSIFNNIEIGKFSFIELPFKENSPSSEVLDGKQRITALVEFKEGRFKYKGYTYRDLSFTDQNHIRHYSVSVSTVEHMTQAQKYEYFLKFNTYGKEQDKEHIKFVKSLLKKASTK